MLTGTALRLISSHRGLVRDKAEAICRGVSLESCKQSAASRGIARFDLGLADLDLEVERVRLRLPATL